MSLRTNMKPLDLPTITEMETPFDGSFSGDGESGGGPLIEVTLQSIKGITYRPEVDDGNPMLDFCNPDGRGCRPKIPNITAAVAFSGSAHDMQVSSSFLCHKTGNLMVESHQAQLLPTTDCQRKSYSFPMVANWTHVHDRDLINEELRPHLSVRVQDSDSRIGRMPLSRMNRDSNIVQSSPRTPPRRNPPHQPPSLDESDVSSNSGDIEPQNSLEETRSEIRGGTSVVWSASGAAMPEIIELHVSLKVDEYDVKVWENSESGEHESSEWRETIFNIGTAFLVFFANDSGCTVMDLPIKKNFGAQLDTSGRLTLDENAFIRIRVDVMPQGPSSVTTRQPDFDLYSSERIDASSKVRAEHDKVVLEPILQQLLKAEKMISKPKQRDHRRGSRSRGRSRGRQTYHDASPKEFPGSRMLCGSSMFDMLSKMAGIARCDAAPGFGINRNASMASTIDTAPSLEI
jgi:hypothetical protein